MATLCKNATNRYRRSVAFACWWCSPNPPGTLEVSNGCVFLRNTFSVNSIKSLSNFSCLDSEDMVLYRKTEMIFADTAETEQTIQEAQGWIFYQKAR